LESARIGDVIYTASLRVTGDDGDFTVSPDAVIVEQWVREFRDPSATGATTTAPATLLMPFAAPFTELHSGYFAGNWVRRPVFTLPGRNSFLFPYANESTNGVVINSNQYIVYPHTIFEPAAAHLVRLQSTGFTNTGDSELILIEGWEPQTTDKFVFDGSIGGTVGSLFAGAPVLDRTSIPVIPPGMPPAIAAQVTQNWLAGNSFTSGLNANAIAEYLLTFGSELTSNLFIYHFGATAYETHNTADTNIPDIEAMGIFMMQVAGDGNNTNVVIDHRFQVHTSGIAAAGIPIAPTNPLLPTRSARVAANSNRLVFVLTPEDNPFVFSRTEIMMSEDAGNQNITSLVNPGNHLFHLHSTDQSGVRLQRNVVSFSATKALLAVTPAVDEMQVILTVQNAGDFPTEIVELFDRQTNTLHDLRADNAYNFVMLPNDDANRFEVRFVRQEITTGLDNNTTADWFVFSNNNYLTITGLDVSLLNEQMYIRNAAGMLYVQQTINQTPELRINIASLPTGVYMVSIQGRTVKFIK
jgi:hypothetical protein